MPVHGHPKMQVSRGLRDEQLQRVWERLMDGARKQCRGGARAIARCRDCR